MAEPTPEQSETILKEMDEAAIEGGKRRYNEGNKHALLETIVYCNVRQIPLPSWVDEKFLQAKALLETGKLESWDEIFGKPYPKGMTRTGAHTRSLATEIWIEVRQLHQQDPKKYPLAEGLFETVGRKLGKKVGRKLGKSTVSKLYYDVDQFYGQHRK
jgi:hypothetical protein